MIVCLAVAGLLVGWLRDSLLQHGLGQFHRLFDLDGEANVPSWYQSLVLFSCALRSRYVAWVRDGLGDPWVVHWKVLSVVLLFLSLDEAVSFHEMAAAPLRDWLGVGGYLYFAWVLPGATLALVVALALSRFVFHLPPRVRLQFVMAGGLYLAGAVGMEMLGARLSDPWDTQREWAYLLASTAEEVLEMTGAAVLQYALLSPELMLPGSALSEYKHSP
jgi:hypothetical protein